ncbi:MAG: SDR family NAD(P)-dependent oxidoreductase [Sandaracinaceae bacterium]
MIDRANAKESCVITGAGGGLGRDLAERFARRGFRVLCADVDLAAARAAADRAGPEAVAMAHDVRDPAAHRDVADAARRLGPVRVWINNAGILPVGAPWEQDPEVIERTVHVNLLGVIYGAQAAVEAMRDRGGLLINVASISAIVPAPGLAVYGGTKHAVLGFSTGLQGDLRRARIPVDVAVVCPDAMETGMVRAVAHHEASDLLYSAGDRMLTTAEVAERVVGLVDRPKLLTVLPAGRGLLARALQPLPALQLRLLDLFRPAGRRTRRQRGLAGSERVED